MLKVYSDLFELNPKVKTEFETLYNNSHYLLVYEAIIIIRITAQVIILIKIIVLPSVFSLTCNFYWLLEPFVIEITSKMIVLVVNLIVLVTKVIVLTFQIIVLTYVL